MSLYLKQNENRSELQKRVAAELQEKAKQKAAQQDMPDGVDDSAFIRGTQQTHGLAWIWIVLGIIVIVGLIILVVVTAL